MEAEHLLAAFQVQFAGLECAVRYDPDRVPFLSGHVKGFAGAQRPLAEDGVEERRRQAGGTMIPAQRGQGAAIARFPGVGAHGAGKHYDASSRERISPSFAVMSAS